MCDLQVMVFLLLDAQPSVVHGSVGGARQGCSTLGNSEHFEQAFDACETGPVAVLAERVGLVCLEDVEGEAA